MTGVKRKREEGLLSVCPKSSSLRGTIGTNLCEKCCSMTSTKEGLCALLRGGYEHHEPSELECSARYGCSLCRIICGHLQRNRSRTTTKPIRFFADCEEQTQPQGLYPVTDFPLGHPFARNPLLYIEAVSEAVDGFTLNAATYSSGYPRPCLILNYTNQDFST